MAVQWSPRAAPKPKLAPPRSTNRPQQEPEHQMRATRKGWFNALVSADVDDEIPINIQTTSSTGKRLKQEKRLGPPGGLAAWQEMALHRAIERERAHLASSRRTHFKCEPRMTSCVYFHTLG